MDTTTRIPLPGFADPAAGAQRTFRAVLRALSRPTIPVELAGPAQAPALLTGTMAALILALCDESTPVWLDAPLRAERELAGWIGFHTGARVTGHPGAAAFAIVSDSLAIPALDEFALGTDEAPHASTTVIAGVRGAGGIPLLADGPGFPRQVEWLAPVAVGFVGEWAGNHAVFPRGVDVVFAGTATVRGLPRTTVLRPVDGEES